MQRKIATRMETPKREAQVIAMLTPEQRDVLKREAEREKRTVSSLIQVRLFPYHDAPTVLVRPAALDIAA